MAETPFDISSDPGKSNSSTFIFVVILPPVPSACGRRLISVSPPINRADIVFFHWYHS